MSLRRRLMMAVKGIFRVLNAIYNANKQQYFHTALTYRNDRHYLCLEAEFMYQDDSGGYAFGLSRSGNRQECYIIVTSVGVIRDRGEGAIRHGVNFVGEYHKLKVIFDNGDISIFVDDELKATYKSPYTVYSYSYFGIFCRCSGTTGTTMSDFSNIKIKWFNLDFGTGKVFHFIPVFRFSDRRPYFYCEENDNNYYASERKGYEWLYE